MAIWFIYLVVQLLSHRRKKAQSYQMIAIMP